MLPARQHSFDHEFYEIYLFPSFIGGDGRTYRYADAYITGTATIVYDADGDWWVEEIRLATTEKVHGFLSSTPQWKSRKIERTEPFYALIKQAIEREEAGSIRSHIKDHHAMGFDADAAIHDRRLEALTGERM